QIDGHPVIPSEHGGVYSVATLPTPPGQAAPSAEMTVAIEYRVPAAAGMGPQFRPLLVPSTDQPVLHFELALHAPDDVRVESLPARLSFVGYEEGRWWFQRLLGPFARAGHEPFFNPLQPASWPALLRGEGKAAHAGTADRMWRAAAAHVPSEMWFVI